MLSYFNNKPKNDLLSVLLAKPGKQHEMKTYPTQAGIYNQADLLFLPNDEGFKYLLVVVDPGSRLMDCIPLKSKDSETIIDAFERIHNNKIISKPKIIQVDDGSEFKGRFKRWCEVNDIKLRVGEPGRHQQQALVETRNKAIGKIILERQLAEEMLTHEKSIEWTIIIPEVIENLNKKYGLNPAQIEKRIEAAENKGVIITETNKDILPAGTKVRYLLDYPIDYLTKKKLHGKFRTGDIRWYPEPAVTKTVFIHPGLPPLYKISGRTNLFTREQLQVVSDNEKLPDATVQKKYIIEGIIGDKKIKNKTYYRVQWKGYDAPTWEPEENLLKDVPDMIREYKARS